MELTSLIVRGLVIFTVFAVTLLIATYSTLAERKIAGFLQDRLGPDRAGPFGILQPLADAVKLFFKEEFIPSHANKWLFIVGPSLAMLTALMSSAVIPFGNEFSIDGQLIPVQGITVNIGLLYIFGVVSLGVYGLMIGGWASNNKFSLLGAIRAASQNISYELAMGMSIIAVLMLAGSLDLRQIVIDQQDNVWNVVRQPLGCVIFITCAFAECNRTPFDLPECEQELVGGYHTEYGSMKLGLYLFSEYINMFVSSAVIATLYFGGYDVPYLSTLGLDKNIETIIGIVALFGKIFFFIFFFMWVRWTLPRFRYDQLMNLGWKSLIPLAILNLILTGGGILVWEHFTK
jgi:NADH-quinone oxidoreductase subunit H